MVLIYFVVGCFTLFMSLLLTYLIGRNCKEESTEVINKCNNNNIYVQKKFLTNSELSFLNKIKELEIENGLKVVPQVNLATIIKKVSNIPYQTELFRNVDYGIFSNNYEKILLLIELNDSTHQQKNRKYRDNRVHGICNMANIKLITFYTQYPNEKEYVKNRIKNEILKNDGGAVGNEVR